MASSILLFHRDTRFPQMDLTPCPFCTIAQAYPPPSNGNAYIPKNPDPELISPNCYLILNTPTVMAFLDIMPISPGHVLVVSRHHREKLKDLKGNEGAALGSWLPIVSGAVMRALGKGEGDWNVVQNNGQFRPLWFRLPWLLTHFIGASAAQVVPHVHYHIIPRVGNVPEIKARSWTMFGKGQRADLDDEEGALLGAKMRTELQEELKRMEISDVEGLKLLGKL